MLTSTWLFISHISHAAKIKGDEGGSVESGLEGTVAP